MTTPSDRNATSHTDPAPSTPRKEVAVDLVDVLVVGSGAAGTAAALVTGAAGLHTLVVESADVLGGAARLSGGGCCIAGSPLQRELGIEDDVETALADWVRWGGPTADMAWARDYLEHGVDDVYRWIEDIGARWEGVLQFEGNRVPRWHYPIGGGAKLMNLLHGGSAGLPVTWMTGVSVTGIQRVEEQTVAATLQDGRTSRHVETRAIVVATGGFTGSPAALQPHLPEEMRSGTVLCGGAPGADGSGLRLLEELGAETADTRDIWTYPYATVDIRDPSGRRGLAVRGIADVVWVNPAGERFHDESKNGGATGTPALLAQDPPTCWAVLDQREARRVTLSDPAFGWDGAPDRSAIDRFLKESPFVQIASTLEQLEAECGMPHGPLRRTIDTFNSWIADGRTADPAHGRRLAGLNQIVEAPFYAIQFFPMARKSLGGIRTDAHCRVRLRSGQTLSNVFAAGEVAGMAGGNINGTAALEGTMLGPSLYSGKVAGRAACSLLRPPQRVAEFQD